MNEALFPGRGALERAFADLRRDLVHDGGPRISTMRNYRFAILLYEVAQEFRLRRHTKSLANDLEAHGWVVLSISLQHLLLERIRGLGDDVQRIIEMEHRLEALDAPRGLKYIADKLAPMIEGPEGLAADVVAHIEAFVEANPDKAERTLTIIGRAGALYPFFRTSALLKHIDGRTRNVPVVLLYPGERRGDAGLSFMGERAPDRDYRPRIYS